MKTISSIQLLESLQADTREIILELTKLMQQDPELLMQQPGEGRWSVAQALAHLNSYGRYYLPAIEKQMNKQTVARNEHFTPGWLGNYFTKLMAPNKQGQIANKMQSPKDHRPGDVHSKPEMDEFMQQEQQLLALLEQAKQTDIGRIRVPISLTRFIRLKLGDTFRFLIAHHQRHFVQIRNTMAELKQSRHYGQRMMEQS